MNTIVIGSNHNNTLGLVWSLGEAGHAVTVLLYEGDNNFVLHSRYIGKSYLVKQGDDILPLLIEVVKKMSSKPVVFVASDVDATILNNHFAELAPYCFFEGGRLGDVNRYRDKRWGGQEAKKCGFLMPNSSKIDSPEELNSIDLKYPLFIKASNSVYNWKSAMKRCDTKEIADSFVVSLSDEFFPLMVQEFIEKEYEIMLLGCSLYGGNRVFCPVANKKIRHFPPIIGPGCYSESVEVAGCDELQQLAEKISHYLKDIEYSGNFSAEFLYSKGNYYFLEINLRNDGTSWLSTCSGYNLPDMVCRSFFDDNVSMDCFKFRPMYYMDILSDFCYVWKGTVRFRSWIKQFGKNTCYSNYNPRDWKPFYRIVKSDIKERFMHWLRKMKK